MKKLIYILLLLPAWCFAQSNTTLPTGTTAVTNPSIRLLNAPDTLARQRWDFYPSVGYDRTVRWVELAKQYFNKTAVQAKIDSASAQPVITGGTITSVPTVGFNPGSNLTAAAWITASYYRSANPTAILTGGGNIRITAAATTNANLTYTYGKVTGTLNIASATINGSTSGVTQNSNGTTGTYVASVPTSAFGSTTYTLLVTTTDSKTTSDAVTFTVLNDRFWFRSANSTPDATIIQAATGGGSGLSASRTGTFVITASGTNYPGFAYPARLGVLTSIKDANNVEVLSGYNTGTLSIITAGGFTESYRYYINQNATAGNTTMVTL